MKLHKLMGMLLLCALLALAVAACGGKADPQAVAASDEVTGGPVLGTLAFEGSELHFQPAAVEVDRPGRYAVTLRNVGHTDHDWVAGGARLIARPGATVSGEIVVPAEGLEFVCSFPGHAAAGMRGRIVVNGAEEQRAR